MVKGGWYWAGNYSGYGRLVKDTLEANLGKVAWGFPFWFQGSWWWQNSVKGQEGKDHMGGDLHNDTFIEKIVEYSLAKPYTNKNGEVLQEFGGQMVKSSKEGWSITKMNGQYLKNV